MGMVEDLQAFPIKANTKVVSGGTETLTTKDTVVHLQDDGTLTVGFDSSPDIVIDALSGSDFKLIMATSVSCTSDFIMSI